MKGFLKLFIGLFLTLLLTGCIGEDYDVGVPTAHLSLDHSYAQLKEANISWLEGSKHVQKTIGDIQKFALSQPEIKVNPNQKVF